MSLDLLSMLGCPSTATAPQDGQAVDEAGVATGEGGALFASLLASVTQPAQTNATAAGQTATGDSGNGEAEIANTQPKTTSPQVAVLPSQRGPVVALAVDAGAVEQTTVGNLVPCSVGLEGAQRDGSASGAVNPANGTPDSMAATGEWASKLGEGTMMTRQNNLAPGFDAPAPGLDTKTLGIDAKAPMLDARAQALDTRTPALDTRTPVLDARTPVLDTKTPVLDAKAPMFDDLASHEGSRARRSSTTLTASPVRTGVVDLANSSHQNSASIDRDDAEATGAKTTTKPGTSAESAPKGLAAVKAGDEQQSLTPRATRQQDLPRNDESVKPVGMPADGASIPDEAGRPATDVTVAANQSAQHEGSEAQQQATPVDSPAVTESTAASQTLDTSATVAGTVNTARAVMATQDANQTATPSHTPVDPSRIQAQVARALAAQGAFTGGDETVSLKLNPEHLGRVDVKLVANGNRLEVVFTAETAEAEMALREGARDLARTLGVRADGRWQHVDVKVTESAQSKSGQDESGQDDQDEERQQRDQRRDSNQQDSRRQHRREA